MDLHLRGKRVLITGASKGIGAAAAEAFAEEGCDLMLAARNGEQLKALADRLRSAPPDRRRRACRRPAQPRAICAELATDAADIDILVNNAGDIPGGSIDKIDEATWRHAWELKVFGYINLTRADLRADEGARPWRHRQRHRRGRRKIRRQLHLRQRRQCGADGVHPRARRQEPARQYPRRRHQSRPGRHRPPRHADEDARARTSSATRTATRNCRKACRSAAPRMPREIGDLMAFLASDRSGYTSGVIFTVDGGYHVRGGVRHCSTQSVIARSVATAIHTAVVDMPQDWIASSHRRSPE